MSDRASRAFATRDAVRREHQAAAEPHRVIVRAAPAGYQRAHAYGSRAWCSKPGCRWTWDGIGNLDHYRAEHEALNDTEPPAA